MTQIIEDILKLSVSERILLVETIWDSIISNENELKLSNETKQLLDERLEIHNENPEAGSQWDEVKNRIKSKMK